MAFVRDVVNIMNSWAPPSLAEDWDNVGLLTGDPNREIDTVIVTLDVTSDVLDAAVQAGNAMIVCHHPLIFKPLTRLTGNRHPLPYVRRAVSHEIPVFVAHTNLDRVADGVSGALARRLNLTGTRFLVPGNGLKKFVTYVPSEYTDRVREAAGYAGAGVIGDYSLCSFSSSGTGTFIPSSSSHPYSGSAGELSRDAEERLEMIVTSHAAQAVVDAARQAHPYEEMAYDLISLDNPDISHGYGIVGTLEESVTYAEFLGRVATAVEREVIAGTGYPDKPIRTVAVMGGSGSSFIGAAQHACVDVYVTGDLGYHDLMNNSGVITLIDASHQGTETPVLYVIRDRIACKLADRQIQVQICKNRHEVDFFVSDSVSSQFPEDTHEG